MNDMTMERDFNVFKEDFLNGDFDLNTIVELIIKVRHYRNKLTSEQAAILLEIPLNVLENDVELKNNGDWQRRNSDHFSGNMGANIDYIKELRDKIMSNNYELNDIYDLTKYVQENFASLSGSVEYLLRNAEVTIRNDVNLYSYSNFNKSGKVFAKYIEKALNI